MGREHRDLAAGTKTRVLVNDRPDVALAARVDGVPVVAIGGITRANAQQVLSAGAACIGGIRLFQMD